MLDALDRVPASDVSHMLIADAEIARERVIEQALAIRAVRFVTDDNLKAFMKPPVVQPNIQAPPEKQAIEFGDDFFAALGRFVPHG